MNHTIKNARIVLRDEIITGSVRVTDGVIESIDSGFSSAPDAIDFAGDYLLPGFVELHTDNLEQELEPRPGVFWPDTLASVLAHDATMIGAGITTVLDAVALGEYFDGPCRTRMLDMSLKSLRKARATGFLKADHKLHLRCEYADPKVMELLTPNIDEDVLMLISLMDHTPGQRQFRDTDKYRTYFKKGWSDEEYAQIEERLIATQAQCAARHRQQIVEMCHARNIPIASHDDTTPDHIDQAVRERIAISEFPTTREAASLARKAGISIIMGGPNVVRDGSHSGNVAARELAAQGLLDIISSDYVPGSLVSAAFALYHHLGISLPECVAKISANPAAAIGLTDRGEIRIGMRGDMVRVREIDTVPVVLRTWATGMSPSSEITEKSAA